MDNLLNMMATVKRANNFEAVSGPNSFYTDLYTDYTVQEVPCRITRKSAVLITNQVNSRLQGTLRAYFKPDADIKKGDLIECNEHFEERFRVEFVYKPNNHHLEADLEIVPEEA